jgi:thiamine-monophosphate kinase
MAPPDEFGLIARYFSPLAAGASESFALGDDAALVPLVPRCDTVVSTDCMVSGVHFLDSDGPDRIARKLLRVNLSDIAAMGARPTGYLLALALPRQTGESWIAAFAAALADDQRRFGVHLLGGDTTATPDRLVATITAFGAVPHGQALRRNGARPGDAVFVSGTIGDAALGLAYKLGKLGSLTARQALPLLERLHLPEPRLALGHRLLGIATAGLDVSDGLAQDIGHIARQSGLRIEIELSRMPLSPAGAFAVKMEPSRLLEMVSGGDDYELAFTAAPAAEPLLVALAGELGLPLTRVGRCLAGAGVAVLDREGRELPLARTGYTHF